MSVKRLRWEQVENSEGTIWGQVSCQRLVYGMYITETSKMKSRGSYFRVVKVHIFCSLERILTTINCTTW